MTFVGFHFRIDRVVEYPFPIPGRTWGFVPRMLPPQQRPLDVWIRGREVDVQPLLGSGRAGRAESGTSGQHLFGLRHDPCAGDQSHEDWIDGLILQSEMAHCPQGPGLPYEGIVGSAKIT